jgi:hypothetical protein
MERSSFEAIFIQLREMLRRQSGGLAVSADRPGYYCLKVDFNSKLGKGFSVAWVKIGKSYVSYHFMPIYMFPKLRDGLSKELRARMQGKSCFNFKIIDEGLFGELEQLTSRGLTTCRDLGFGPDYTR